MWHVVAGSGSGSVPEQPLVRALVRRTEALAAAAAAEEGGVVVDPSSSGAAGHTPAGAREEGEGGVRCVATVQTLAGVSRLAWRPVLSADVPVAAAAAWGETGDECDVLEASRSSSHRGGAPQGVDFQLATAAALLDRQVHVWDLRDASIPAAVFSGHRDVVAGVAWVRSSGDGRAAAPPWLVSGGKDGRLNLHDPARAQRPRRALCPASVASSSTDLAWFGRVVDRDRFWGAGGEAPTEHGEAPPGPPPSRAPGAASPAAPPVVAAVAATFHILSSDPVGVRKGRGAGGTSAASGCGGDRPALTAAAFDPSPHTFAILALTYVTDGAPAHVLCRCNAATAERLGLVETAQVWRVFEAAFAPASLEAPQPQPHADVGKAGRQSAGIVTAAASTAASAAPLAGRDLPHPVHGPLPAAPSPRSHTQALVARPAELSAEPPPPASLPQLERAADRAASADPAAAAWLAPPATLAAPRVFHDSKASLCRSLLLASRREGTAAEGDSSGATVLTPTTLSAAVPGYIGGLLEALASAAARDDTAHRDRLVSGLGGAGGGGRPEASAAPAPAPPESRGVAAGGTANRAAQPLQTLDEASLPPPLQRAPPPLPPSRGGLASPMPVLPGSLPPAPTSSSPAPESLSTIAAASWREFWLETAVDVLRHYAERGDVQLCVTLARVLDVPVAPRAEQGSTGRARRACVPRAQMNAWIGQYIEQLHRLQLWSPASTVIARAGDELVRSLNQLHTAVAAACARCARDIVAADVPLKGGNAGGTRGGGDGGRGSLDAAGGGAAAASTAVAEAAAAAAMPQPVVARRCTSCTAPALSCAVCSEPVRGAYVWCQGCGHGGHLAHMLGWFTRSSLCPSGCMHVCDLSHGSAVSSPAVAAGQRR